MLQLNEYAESPASFPLAETVRIALGKTGHSRMQCVAVTFESGTLVLQGRVPSYYLKQLAQETVQGLPGIHAVRNELQVEAGHRT
jgi:osmotically-inducible protein OsmY